MISLLTAESVAIVLGKPARKSGGGFMACCPAHKDNTPSLSIDEKDGKILFKCMAGCPQDSVVSALKDLGLLPGTDSQRELPKVKSKVVGRYEYHDTDGKLLYWKERLEPGRNGRSKEFRFRHTDPTTGENAFGHGKHNPHILYNLPAVVKSKSVIFCEGEKQCDLLGEWGLVATTIDTGASGTLTSGQVEQLTGKRVAILHDHDEPGLMYALNQANALHGKAESLKVVLLPGLDEKGDVIDWAAEPGNDRATLLDIIKATDEWTPDPTPSHAPILENTSQAENGAQESTELPGNTDVARKSFSLKSGRDLRAMDIRVEWLIDGVVPRHSVVLLYGRGGIGKTTLMMMLANALDRGESVFGMNTVKTQVIIVDYENSLAVLSERAKRTAVDGVLFLDSSQNPPPLDKDGWDEYLSMLEYYPGALFVFDTLRSAHSGDENDSRVMTLIMYRMRQLRDAGATVILLHHTPKSNDRQFKGSGAIFDLCDQTLALYQTKQVGSDQEAADDDDEPDKVYRFGTGKKTRYRPHRVYLSFNAEQEVFVMAKNPEDEALEYLHGIISQIDATSSAKQKTIVERVEAEGDLDLGGDKKIIGLLKRGTGRFWTTSKGMHNAIIYHPIQFGSLAAPIGVEKLPNWNHATDQQGTPTGKQSVVPNVQTPADTEFGSLAGMVCQTEKPGESFPDFDF